jgi:hypothetical protein
MEVLRAALRRAGYRSFFSDKNLIGYVVNSSTA